LASSPLRCATRGEESKVDRRDRDCSKYSAPQPRRTLNRDPNRRDQVFGGQRWGRVTALDEAVAPAVAARPVQVRRFAVTPRAEDGGQRTDLVPRLRPQSSVPSPKADNRANSGRLGRSLIRRLVNVIARTRSRRSNPESTLALDCFAALAMTPVPAASANCDSRYLSSVCHLLRIPQPSLLCPLSSVLRHLSSVI
jgi:hypothetical protein